MLFISTDFCIVFCYYCVLNCFLPRKGSSLATQMLAIGFQHELFQLRLFQWFLGISKVCGLRQLCLQANVWGTVVSRETIRHLIKLWPSKDSWLCHSKWSAGLWKTCHDLYKDWPKDTPSNHEVSSRLLWLLPKSCLSKRVRHRQRTLIASALAFSFGLWDYDIWPFGPVLENGVTTCYEYYKAKKTHKLT